MTTVMLSNFLDLSVNLTGFSEYRLVGTGNTQTFLDLLIERCGEETVIEMLNCNAQIEVDDLDRGIRHDLLSSPRFGPIARNLLRLWFIGTWAPMPSEWYIVYGHGGQNGAVIPTSSAYTSGLLWPTVGATPSGAKALGYGMWARAPQFIQDN
jgi:hypothetical protein